MDANLAFNILKETSSVPVVFRVFTFTWADDGEYNTKTAQLPLAGSIIWFMFADSRSDQYVAYNGEVRSIFGGFGTSGMGWISPEVSNGNVTIIAHRGDSQTTLHVFCIGGNVS